MTIIETKAYRDAAARNEGPGPFTYDFEYSYDFGKVQYSHGGGTVRGLFSGNAEDRGAIYAIRGESKFWFTDVFADPLGPVDPIDLRLEPGTPYPISGDWTANFTAEIFSDKSRSEFFHKD